MRPQIEELIRDIEERWIPELRKELEPLGSGMIRTLEIDQDGRQIDTTQASETRSRTRNREGAGQRTGSYLTKSPERTSAPKLSDFGVTKQQSHRWQKLAELSDDDFEKRSEAIKKRAVSSVDGSLREEKACHPYLVQIRPAK